MRHLNKTNLRYPGLWRGCVGAWAPLLGPSGTTLRDNSGRGESMIGTGFDDTMWTIRSGYQAIKFDGTDDIMRRDGFMRSTLAFPFSISCWVYLDTITNGHSLYVANTSTANQYFGLLYTGGQYSFVARNAAPAQTIGVTRGIAELVHCVAVAHSATSRFIYVNGQKSAEGTISVTLPTIDAVSLGVQLKSTPGFAASNIIAAMIHDRAITESEIKTLLLRPGIAYETTTRRSPAYVAASTGNRRRRLLCR